MASARQVKGVRGHWHSALLDRAANQAEVKADPRESRWQAEDDPWLWKLIIAPEFGEKIDLGDLTLHASGEGTSERGWSGSQSLRCEGFGTTERLCICNVNGKTGGSRLDIRANHVVEAAPARVRAHLVLVRPNKTQSTPSS
jgi:hypothetical protein